MFSTIPRYRTREEISIFLNKGNRYGKRPTTNLHQALQTLSQSLYCTIDAASVLDVWMLLAVRTKSARPCAGGDAEEDPGSRPVITTPCARDDLPLEIISARPRYALHPHPLTLSAILPIIPTFPERPCVTAIPRPPYPRLLPRPSLSPLCNEALCVEVRIMVSEIETGK